MWQPIHPSTVAAVQWVATGEKKINHHIPSLVSSGYYASDWTVLLAIDDGIWLKVLSARYNEC